MVGVILNYDSCKCKHSYPVLNFFFLLTPLGKWVRNMQFYYLTLQLYSVVTCLQTNCFIYNKQLWLKLVVISARKMQSAHYVSLTNLLVHKYSLIFTHVLNHHPTKLLLKGKLKRSCALDLTLPPTIFLCMHV